MTMMYSIVLIEFVYPFPQLPDKHFEMLMGLFGVFTAFGLYLNMKSPEMREKCNWSPIQQAHLPGIRAKVEE